MTINFRREKNRDKRMPLPRISKGRRRLLAAIGVAAVVLLLWQLLGGSAPKELPPEAAQQALLNTFGAESYRFTTESTVFLSGQQRLFCNLQGEKSGDNRHISGELLGTPLNLYLVEGALFQQSGMDKSWREVASADMEKARQLVGEIAPETNFHYSETGPITYLGAEEVEGQSLHKLELRPTMADVWISRYFTDIAATLWLDEAGQYVVKAQTTAVSAENPTVKLIIDNTFGSFGEAIEIKQPL